MVRSSYSRIAGVLAFSLSLATFLLVIIFAIFLTIDRRRLYILALAAAVTQIILLCTLSHLLVRYTGPATKNEIHHAHEGRERRNMFILVLGIMPSTVAGLVVGAALGWSKASDAQQPGHILGLRSDYFLLISILIWLCAILAQVIFYLCMAWTRTLQRSPTPLHIIEEVQILQEMAEPSRPQSSATNQSVQYHELATSTSPPPSECASSLRSSISMVQRPITSKTRLLIRQHSSPRQSKRPSDSPSQQRASQDSGFDSWDTSAVAPHIRETVLQSSPAMRGKPLRPLEPIPGSRSPSPAKALEGPFFPQPESLSPPPSPLPQPSYSRPGSRQRAASSEDHIHPLFRTCSPTPPPTASSGTTLTAAPYSGKLIDGRLLRRMRSGSLPTSTSPFARSDSLEIDCAPGSAAGPLQESPPTMPDITLPGAYPSSPIAPEQPPPAGASESTS